MNSLPKMTLKVFLRFAIILLFIQILHLNANSQSTNSSDQEYKILFIGSSYFSFNEFTFIVRDIIESSGKNVYIDEIIRDGWYLNDHAKMSVTDLKIKKKWDYVVLQGVGSVIAYPNIFTNHPVYSALEILCNKIISNNESTKIIYCMPWAFEDGMTWMDGWTDDYEEMQQKIYMNTLQYSNELGFMVAPVGWAWRSVLIEKGFPQHYLHREDWNHPSFHGSLLMALVVFSTIYQESSINLPSPGGVSPEELTLFQTVASNMVLNYLNLWNITPKHTGISDHLLVDIFQLSQNHPNPFKSATYIDYEMSNYNFIDLEVYDINGNKISSLVKEYKHPGKYTFKFDGRNLPSGTYFYKMINGDQILTKKMIIHK